jgi:hypothetical protein
MRSVTATLRTRSLRRGDEMENPWWHNTRCAESFAPKSGCRCKQCNKSLHGILAAPRPDATPRYREFPAFPEKKPRKKKVKRIAAIAAVVTVTGTVGGLAATGTFSSPSVSGSSLSVHANVDLNQAISALSRLGFDGKLLSGIGVPYTSAPTTAQRTQPVT